MNMNMFDYYDVEELEDELIEVLDKVYESEDYADLPNEICHEYESGNIVESIIDEYAESGKINNDNIDREGLSNWCDEEFGRRGSEQMYNLIISFYENINNAAQTFLDSKLK